MTLNLCRFIAVESLGEHLLGATRALKDRSAVRQWGGDRSPYYLVDITGLKDEAREEGGNSNTDNCVRTSAHASMGP